MKGTIQTSEETDEVFDKSSQKMIEPRKITNFFKCSTWYTKKYVNPK